MSDCWPEQEAVEKWFDEYVRDKYKIFHSNQDLMKLKDAVTKSRIEVQEQLSSAQKRIKELEHKLTAYMNLMAKVSGNNLKLNNSLRRVLQDEKDSHHKLINLIAELKD